MSFVRIDLQITKNMREMRALSAPLQNAIRELEEEELETRKVYETSEKRINLQEVRHPKALVPVSPCCGGWLLSISYYAFAGYFRLWDADALL